MREKSLRYQSVMETGPVYKSGNLTSISLFSGMLGLDLGLHEAGFTTKVALDFDKDAKKVAELNFPSLPYIQQDISKTTGEELLELAGCQKGEVDLLVGGPPCQPFSKSGLRNGLKDTRGLLFKQYIRLLSDIKPRAFILENVRGLVSSNKGKDFEEILESLRDTGYTVYWRILDAANFGVPQFRQRLFLVGFRDRIKFDFPQETHGDVIDEPIIQSFLPKVEPFVTVYDAIGDLEGSIDYRPYKGKYAHLLSEIPEGLNYSYYCKERGCPNPLFEWRSKFWYFLLKIDRSRPALTIQAYPGNNTGPFHWENRRLGVSELKRLQTIPDWYQMLDSYSANHKLVGNAVPPLLAKCIGKQVRNALEESIPVSKEKFKIITFQEYDNLKVNSGRGSGQGKFEIKQGKVIQLRPASTH